MPRALSASWTSAVESFSRSRWDLKKTTKTGYLGSYRRAAKYGFQTIGDLTLANVNDFLESNADHPTMARNDAIALRQLAKWATKNGIFKVDPLAALSLPRGRGGTRHAFTDKEVPMIVAAASASGFGPRDRAMIVTAISASLRPIELFGLDLSDVNLPEGSLQVRLETTKTEAGQRDIPLDPQAVAALDEYIKDWRGHKDGPLFLNARGDPFKYAGFRSVFVRLGKRLKEQGIQFQPYRMRHTGITNWVRMGTQSLVVKELAGHKSVVTTQHYVDRMSKADLRKVPNAFTALYGRIA